MAAKRKGKKRDLYDDLGVDPEASTVDIKKAYRKKASKTHPDKGGDPEDFQKVNTAYMVLMDPVRRKKYDQTGTVDDEVDNDLARVLGICTSFFARVVMEVDPDSDLIAECVSRIKLDIDRNRQENGKRLRETAKLRKVQKKLKRKDGPAFLERVIEDGIRDIERSCSIVDEEITLHERAVEMLKNYEYESAPTGYVSIFDQLKASTTPGIFGRY